MNSLFKKPSGVRYTDMAIFIDDTFYTDQRDEDKSFSYMYLLAYMLASKAHYFTNIDDYDGYAYLLATSTYERMTDPNKIQIKSVLNYMKKIMYFRKAAYLRETFKEVMDPLYKKGWDSDIFMERSLENLESQNMDTRSLYVSDVLRSLPKIIKSHVPSYLDKGVARKVYISGLLSMLDRLTMPRLKKLYLDE